MSSAIMATTWALPPEPKFKIGKSSDFTIKCRDAEFKVHKAFPAPASEFFNALFKGGFKVSMTSLFISVTCQTLMKICKSGSGMDRARRKRLPSATLPSIGVSSIPRRSYKRPLSSALIFASLRGLASTLEQLVGTVLSLHLSDALFRTADVPKFMRQGTPKDKERIASSTEGSMIHEVCNVLQHSVPATWTYLLGELDNPQKWECPFR
jgi:hypothetical protein